MRGALASGARNPNDRVRYLDDTVVYGDLLRIASLSGVRGVPDERLTAA